MILHTARCNTIIVVIIRQSNLIIIDLNATQVLNRKLCLHFVSDMNSSLQIQKLLACSEEFDEFQELDILIESPFVCETVEGEGVKQVFLGE